MEFKDVYSTVYLKDNKVYTKCSENDTRVFLQTVDGNPHMSILEDVAKEDFESQYKAVSVKLSWNRIDGNFTIGVVE